jgi:response regulator of citrate/malate metabolism
LRFLRFAALIQPEPIKLLITAYKDDHVIAEALRIGVNEFIQKPFKVDSFIELLALTMKRQAA